MDDYINNFDNYTKKIVYNFKMCEGGIGDCIKFFMYSLYLCMKYNIKLYYQINNIPIEKYLKLKYTKMYIQKKDITNMKMIQNEQIIYNLDNDNYNIVSPFVFYPTFNYDNLKINIEDVFDFTDEIKINSTKIFPNTIKDYISIHLRLGDKYLETDKSYVQCKDDERTYNENLIFDYIEKNSDKNIVFFCDNHNYKLKIKNKYNHIFITDCEIGHTSLLNTTDKQTLDTLTEFYIIVHSNKIVSASYSGFSIIASKFRNIPFIKL